MLKGNNVSGKSTGAKAEPAVLDQKLCMYGPQILAIQTNQKLLVKNSDPTSHNVHVNPAVPGNLNANPPNNFMQMQAAPEITLTFPAPENFMKFQCDVHSWMFAWITVVDNPYFAVTDKDGKATKTFTMKGITLGDGETSIVGKGFIVHEKADDMKTQPTGNAGGRAACGVITLDTPG